MNKNPWLIAGTIAAAVASVVSLHATVRPQRTSGYRHNSYSSSRPSRFAELRSNIGDSFGNFAVSTAAAATSIGGSWTDNTSHGSHSSDSGSSGGSSSDCGSF